MKRAVNVVGFTGFAPVEGGQKAQLVDHGLFAVVAAHGVSDGFAGQVMLVHAIHPSCSISCWRKRSTLTMRRLPRRTEGR